MPNKKNGNISAANLISIVVTIAIIILIGVVYYVFLSPKNVQLESIEYSKIDKENYEMDKEFQNGLDTTIDFYYTEDELDIYEDLKDYYQGREDPFSTSEDRQTIPEFEEENKIIDSQTGQPIKREDENKAEDGETGIEQDTKPKQGQSVLNL